ncbi:MAG TPA: hypothetical protein VFO29_04650 [Candidatus Rubrimentiphilum sp.]|nr:hypothetical protein [Candidatus Rubrimentiphilum sp.]
MRKIWLAAGGAAALVAVLAAGFVLWAVPRVPHVIALGTPIQHDDFFFTVIQSKRQQLPDRSARYHVAVVVRNGAKVVNYQWRDAIAYVRAFDDRGFGHDFYPLTHRSFILPAGSARTTELEFRIPPGFSSANLRFWDGIFMGDAINGGAYSREIVPLEAYRPPFGT